MTKNTGPKDETQRTRYFQTVSLDGKETPLDFYRSGSGFEDTWDEIKEQWVTTTSLTNMLIRGDVSLDEVSFGILNRGIELRKTLGTSDIDYLLDDENF
jgi:hypothetical protein